LSELFPDSERARALTLRAAERLAVAGRPAPPRADVLAPLNPLQRAAELRGRPERAVPRGPGPADALHPHGPLEDRATPPAGASARAAGRDDRRNELLAVLALTIHELATRPEGTVEKLERLGAEALKLFAGREDDAGLTRAWLALAYAAHVRGRYVVRSAALERARLHPPPRRHCVEGRPLSGLPP